MNRRNKSSFIGIAAFAIVALLTGTAWSIPWSDIGGEYYDTLITSAALSNSGDETERAWVQSVTGQVIPITLDAKYKDMTWLPVDGETGVYAIDLRTTNPAYFLIKTGKIKDGPYAGADHFLFRNESATGWGVIDLRALGIPNIGKISHVAEFTSSAAVPEPTTFLLLGIGLVGIAGINRKKRRK